VGKADDTQTDPPGVTGQTVLVIDDNRNLADLYATWVARRHEVRTAYSGKGALEKVDEDIDVAFLDRRMPDMSGDEVLERVRERGLDCRVVMVTAVDPDFDIVELPFDEYLTKPVSHEVIEETIENMHRRDDHDEMVQEYLRLTSKKAALEADVASSELAGHEEYQELVRRVEELADRADAVAPDREPGDG
jgi:DNA-binding response OmpR family regulator